MTEKPKRLVQKASFISNSPEETLKAACNFAEKLSRGDIISLNGGLGAGKTVFAKGLAKGLGVKEYRHVNSPSFVIIKEYEGDVPFYHFDVYRFASSDELETVGYEDYFYGEGVTVIEWGDKVKKYLPKNIIHIEIKIIEENKRKIIVKNTKF